MMLRHSYNKLLLGLALALSLPSLCLAERLEVVVAQTVSNNPTILIQTARRYAQDNKLRESISGYLPNIELMASYGREHNKNYFTRLENTVNGELTLTKREAGITIKQMIFDGFAVRSSVEADAALAQSSSYHVLAKLEEVILQVTASYIDTIMQRSIYMHAKECLSNHQDIFDKLSNGTIKNVQPGDLELAKSRLSLTQTLLLDLQRDIRDSQADYIKVVGVKPGVMFRPESPERKLPTSEEAAVAIALNNNPRVFMADAEIRAARADKRVAKSNYFPKIDLEISGTNNKNVDGIRQNTNSLGAMLQMKYNLFHGGKDVAKERKTAWILEEKKELLNEDLRNIEQSVRHVWSAYASYKGQLMYLKQRVDALGTTRNSYFKDVTDGNRRILDLLDAEHELYSAKANYVVAQYKELLSRFMLLQSIGKIREHFNVAMPSAAVYKPTNWLNGF